MRFLLAVVLSGACFAQTPALPVLPSNWVGAGAAYAGGGQPPIAGWASYAVLVSGKAGLYSFSSYDLTVTKAKPYAVQTSVRTGMALVIRTIGPLTILGLGDAGMAQAPTSITGAFSGGGIGIYRIGKTAWTLEVAVRRLKTPINGTSNAYEVGTGRTF
jgi:hypothetical protein